MMKDRGNCFVVEESPAGFDAESSEFDRFIVFTREPGRDEGRFDFVPAMPFSLVTREKMADVVGVETAAHEGERSRPKLRRRWFEFIARFGPADWPEFFAFCEEMNEQGFLIGPAVIVPGVAAIASTPYRSIEAGMGADTATSLITMHGVRRVRDVLAAGRGRPKIENLAGWIVVALRDDLDVGQPHDRVAEATRVARRALEMAKSKKR